MIDNTVDLCPATPAGQQVDSVDESQLDQDNDSLGKPQGFVSSGTDESHSIDLDGCSEYQLDDDEDGVKNIDDDCPRTPTSSIVFDDGCALSQMDSDEDNVNDAEDDFPLDPNETTDSDGDGIFDTHDYYPDDPQNRNKRHLMAVLDWYTQLLLYSQSVTSSPSHRSKESTIAYRKFSICNKTILTHRLNQTCLLKAAKNYRKFKS